MSAPIYKSAMLILFFGLMLSSPLYSAIEEDVVGFWTFEFQPGYNLVTFPVLPDYPSPEQVIADRLGDVEISTYDQAIAGYRWAKYDAEAERWSGNLYIMARGKAYWVRLIDAADSKKLVVTGKPAAYKPFNWGDLENGWQFHAPVYGKNTPLRYIPPAHEKDLLLGWDSQTQEFLLSSVTIDKQWDPTTIMELAADKGYITYLNKRQVRVAGPPTSREDELDIRLASFVNGDGLFANGTYSPPIPLIVGNADGLPVCSEDGAVCSGGFTIEAVRVLDGRDGVGEDFITEVISQQFVGVGGAADGRFKMALSVGGDDRNLQVGDRVALRIFDRLGASTISTSFTVPSDAMTVPDVSFEQPLSTTPSELLTPEYFHVSEAFPNPFNDRFQVDMRLPSSGDVQIKMFDVAGRVVADYSNRYEAGTHRLSVNGGDFATGIYYLQVSNGVDHAISKVAYIK